MTCRDEVIAVALELANREKAQAEARAEAAEAALQAIAALEVSGYESVNSTQFGKAKAIAAAALVGVEPPQGKDLGAAGGAVAEPGRDA